MNQTDTFMRILCSLCTGMLFTLLLLPESYARPFESNDGYQAADADSVIEVSENDYYRILTIPAPAGVELEVGGLERLPNGKLAVATRRGEIWILDNPVLGDGVPPHYTKFAEGLYEILGLEYRDGSFYVAQRGELNRLTDTDKDGKADLYERIYAWPISGHYHEYSFGPAFLPNGDMVVTGNVAFGDEKWWEAESRVPWRGWAMAITPEGEMNPIATGMRSPSGVMVNDRGDILYTENQGDWIGSGFISHVEEGDFLGNVAGLRWADHPESPVSVQKEDIVDSERPMFETAARVPGLKLPAVWIPHTLMGISTSDLIQDSEGFFPHFQGHYFVGDQGHARINRVDMEIVNGEYQGAVFPFSEGFLSGVMRMEFGPGSSLFVGMTDRGWRSTGEETHGLQWMVWNEEIPFEMKTIRAQPDGFLIEFTHPVDRELASDPLLYSVTSFTYMYRYDYGSPIIEQEPAVIRGLQVSEDGKRVRLAVDNMREKYIHEVKLGALLAADGTPLLHDTGYYTLNHIPEGEGLSEEEMTPAPGQTARAAVSGSGTAEANVDVEGAGTAIPREMKRVTEMPLAWGGDADREIEMGTEPGLQFDITEIEVNRGDRVALTFTNDDNMVHNFVLVEPEAGDEVGEAAINLGLQGSDMDYVPDSGKVIAFTSLLQPAGSETIYFSAPDEPGIYTYLCTFPGHHIAMRGRLVVR
ncbi:MAG: plastocyanin/azurin family copper-binding protein [Balneolaceae bacterium]